MKRYGLIVVGGGPAGLSAAIEAAKRGIETVVFDENARPGGQLFKQIHIITGRVPGRQSEDEIIIYSVGGMPVEDIAWGSVVYQNAVKMGIGTQLPLWDTPEMA